MRRAASKIGTLEEVGARLDAARAGGHRIALATGVFDVLTVQHVRELARARAEADVLVVAVRGDAAVRRREGPGRPVQAEHDRALLVAALRSVDHVLVFHEDDVQEVLQALGPDIHCVPAS